MCKETDPQQKLHVHLFFFFLFFLLTWVFLIYISSVIPFPLFLLDSPYFPSPLDPLPFCLSLENEII